ncbi:UDP-glucose 4-epimerase GalE [Immundisolibacter cernigliae]|uniref:UDP-glucose 4-epimerase n=1 Tax=Immundisolibacter cernigliae TaxID=1810504 RepID=A0A1B1YTJ8_9GAMM|nr:UDP-glucose 4-epimerase GalE [Immundisolibacter cernigliae]ANX04027.1 UDP-glucose 4-epimerase GalE [Immundisolibacter cernigliae]
MRLLVTGGAGYIGSHVTRQLVEAGHDVTVYDNLGSGFRWATLGAPLVEADLADTARLDATLAAGRFEAVLHFAAHIVVPESVADPLKYYANNTRNTLGLLQALLRHGVRRLVFSSTAAVYGTPEHIPVSESAPLLPINPYGASKLMSERMISDLAATGALDHVTLRYFNVAGADPGGRLGQATPAATHLIKVACELACGKRERIDVFGTDYPTPDGTCVRDYIHVEDLARAHVLALDHLAAGGQSLTLNCGYGHGYSVREVLAAVERQHGQALTVRDTDRRPGDPAALVADSSRIRSALGWQPQHDDLDFIVRTALDWERSLPRAG